MIDNNKEIKNVIMYCRTSSELQADNFSIAMQKNAIKDYCNKHNYNLIGEYIDECKSGTSTNNRTDFHRMLEDIKNNPTISAVLIYRISRISRSLADTVNTIQLLDHYNVNLISTEDNLNTGDMFGRTIVYILGTFAELDRNNIVSTCRSGMMQRSKEGLWNGGRVFGYRSNSKKELEIVPEQAKVIQQIFNLYSNENWGYKKIACYLNSCNHKTLKGGDWSIQSIKQILDNPIYAGYIRWGQYVNWRKTNRKGKNDNYQLTKGIHLPIIDDNTWKKTQDLRKVNKNKFPKLYEGDFILTGLLKCPNCGASMISHRTKKRNKVNEFYRYYQCSNFFNKGATVCKSNLINADIAEKYVLDKINELINSEEIIKSLISKLNKKTSFDIAPLNKKLSSLEKNLREIELNKLEAYKQKSLNIIDFKTLNDYIKFLIDEENKLTLEINTIKSSISQLTSYNNIDTQKIITILQNFNDIFKSATIQQRKSLLHSIIDSISIHKGNTIKERTINKIKLHFEPVDVQAQKINKKFATTYGTVLRYTSKGCYFIVYLAKNFLRRFSNCSCTYCIYCSSYNSSN